MRITIEELENIVKEAGYPTEGHLAAWIWRTLSASHADGPFYGTTSTCADYYRRLGYVPFEGYPLKRAK